MTKTYKKRKSNKNSQYKYRRTSFSFYQYWIFYYTEHYKNGSEKDFVTFIKAKSYELAKNILSQKVEEDNPGAKTKSVQGYMLHKNYKNTRSGRHFSMSDWAKVKDSSFPNLSNFLFKKETERPEGFSNRLNKTNLNHLKKIGFKKGKENWSTANRKGLFLPLDQRRGKKWNGDKWVKWCPEEMKKTKSEIINALILEGGNRKNAAKHLNIGRNTLYKLMLRCEEKAWWDKHYPPVKPVPPRVPREQRSATQKKVMKKRMENGEIPFASLTKEQRQAKIANSARTKREKSEKKYNDLIPKMKEALLASNNSRTKAANLMGIKVSTFRKYIQKTKHKIDWASTYPVIRK